MTLSKNEKIGLGVLGAAVAVGAGYAYYEHTKKKADVATTGTGDVNVPVEAIYSAVPAVAIDPSTMPMLREASGSTAGQTYWILGDQIAANASATTATNGNTPVAAPSSSTSDTYIADLSAQLANHGLDGMAGGKDGAIPAADLWIIELSGAQKPVNVGAAKESLAQLRKIVGTQRILWALAKDTDPSIAKALAESHEEWLRSYEKDNATGGRVDGDVIAAANAPDATTLAQLFPPAPPAGA